MGVVDDHDVADAEQMLGDGDGAQRVDARPPATMTGKRVVEEATRLPAASRMTWPGKTSSPNSFATALGISAARGS
jgi:hypothetical protein